MVAQLDTRTNAELGYRAGASAPRHHLNPRGERTDPNRASHVELAA